MSREAILSAINEEPSATDYRGLSKEYIHQTYQQIKDNPDLFIGFKLAQEATRSAIFAGYSALAQKIINKCPPELLWGFLNETDKEDGRTLLHFATIHERPNIVELLIEQYSRFETESAIQGISKQDASGNTALHIAVTSLKDAKNAEIIEILLKSPAKAELLFLKDNENFSAINLFDLRNNVRFQEILLKEAQAEVNEYVDSMGSLQNSLFDAIERKNSKDIDALLTANPTLARLANLNRLTNPKKEGESLLDAAFNQGTSLPFITVAKHYSHKSIKKFLISEKILKTKPEENQPEEYLAWHNQAKSSLLLFSLIFPNVKIEKLKKQINDPDLATLLDNFSTLQFVAKTLYSKIQPQLDPKLKGVEKSMTKALFRAYFQNNDVPELLNSNTPHNIESAFIIDDSELQELVPGKKAPFFQQKIDEMMARLEQNKGLSSASSASSSSANQRTTRPHIIPEKQQKIIRLRSPSPALPPKSFSYEPEAPPLPEKIPQSSPKIATNPIPSKPILARATSERRT